jgi:capsular polysaccharide transport system permease protein
MPKQKAIRSPILYALQSKRNAIWAVMLRDMRSRFFNHGMGFILVPLWPLAHMVIIMAIRAVALHGASPPYGESSLTFYATGLIPTLSFVYMSRFMGYSLLTNKAMLAFPRVKILDVLFGRAALEFISSVITIFLLMIILLALGEKPFPIDLERAVICYFATIYLAVGCGALVGVLSMLQPMIMTMYQLSTIIIYVLSGTIFVASNLPSSVGNALSYLPVTVCVEWMRTAYYETYSDRLVYTNYVFWFATVALLLGLALEKILRGRLFE